MIKNFLYFFSLIFFCGYAFAKTPADYAKYYEIDLDEDLPPLEELQKKYMTDNSDYNRRYKSKFFIGNVFDSVFRKAITLYGSDEARIVSQTEEDLIDMLQMLPKEYYQYIGPYIHIAYGIPEKIKNMPGIKETKNKFPSRIAPQLADMEDIEFLSPYLYILLMPEIWPSNLRENEYVKMPKDDVHVHVKMPESVVEKANKLLDIEKFYPDYKPDSKNDLSELRTIKPDKNSPLTGGDIKAFAKSISKVNDFAKKPENFKKIAASGIFLDMYEADHNIALPVNTLKELVHPCRRLVQKIKIAGLKTEFSKLLAEEGFDANGWAYTCDKSIKAYRLSRISSHTMQSIMDFKGRVYESYMYEILSDKKLDAQFAAMQSVIEMYKSPDSDWMEMMKHYKDLRKEFENNDYKIGITPISF